MSPRGPQNETIKLKVFKTVIKAPSPIAAMSALSAPQLDHLVMPSYPGPNLISITFIPKLVSRA